MIKKFDGNDIDGLLGRFKRTVILLLLAESISSYLKFLLYFVNSWPALLGFGKICSIKWALRSLERTQTLGSMMNPPENDQS